MISIIDYGMGNIGSIANMIKKAGGEVNIVDNPKDLENAKGLILPGVGAFDNGMNNLEKLGFVDIIRKKVIEEKTPILGICLGMQLMTKSSEEGVKMGLNLIEANTKKFILPEGFKIPHMGWNHVKCEKRTALNKNFTDEFKYYFVHSYFVECENKEDILMSTSYVREFCSAFQHENIIGVQFHPEKSHNFGLKLFENFWETL